MLAGKQATLPVLNIYMFISQYKLR